MNPVGYETPEDQYNLHYLELDSRQQTDLMELPSSSRVGASSGCVTSSSPPLYGATGSPPPSGSFGKSHHQQLHYGQGIYLLRDEFGRKIIIKLAIFQTILRTQERVAAMIAFILNKPLTVDPADTNEAVAMAVEVGEEKRSE